MLADIKEQLEERRARVQELRKYMEGQVTETQLMQVCGMITTLPYRTWNPYTPKHCIQRVLEVFYGR